MSRLWDKGEALDELVLAFTVGRDHELDARLVPYDVRASCAHATMLSEQGHLSAEDCKAIAQALEDLAREHAAGQWSIAPEEEDVHTALESRLVERLGDAGKRVHLGRSRNDQVLAALRLYLLDVTAELGELGQGVCGALADLEAAQGKLPLPGYTHLQRAMPSSVALWARGFAAEIADDLDGLQACTRRISKNPLGSAAGYGVPVLSIDRERTRELLGFQTVHEPVTAVQLSRGKAEAALVLELTLLARDLGRLASELCLFATKEFGFVQLAPAVTTGSSIMPQKRNPDVFELLRGRAAAFPAHLQALLAITAGLPAGYHRDLQLLKEHLFAAIDEASLMLRVTARALPLVRFDADRLAAAMDPDLDATARAYRLVTEQGLPFRDAYQKVARELADPGSAGPGSAGVPAGPP